MNNRFFREIAVTVMIQQHMPREATAPPSPIFQLPQAASFLRRRKSDCVICVSERAVLLRREVTRMALSGHPDPSSACPLSGTADIADQGRYVGF
jgi:hypothetical protein